MGILNTTPDSFSDGGDHLDPAMAAAAGVAMGEAGAAVLDIGGESTRPGAERVSGRDQIERVVPVIRALRAHPSTGSAVITIDTTLASVAEAALDAGADAINDVSAGLEDPGIIELAADRGAGLILMHRLRPPDRDRYSDRYEDPPVYEDVVEEVRSFLDDRVRHAEQAGVRPEAIAVDPGLGFGKTVPQNLELIHGLRRIVADGRPVLVGASRKSFLGAISGETDPRGREVESVASGIEAWRRGAGILRVHRVDDHRRALAVVRAISGLEAGS
ncbi:MAG: dihydropteroate synthase [Phycisphaerae bacterium]|nr:dihydropteroate synthase [Phycisphaerae bacterium]